jgi:hypothetical protein
VPLVLPTLMIAAQVLYIESHFQAMVSGSLVRWPQVDRFYLGDSRIGTISAFLDTFPLGLSPQALQARP